MHAVVAAEILHSVQRGSVQVGLYNPLRMLEIDVKDVLVRGANIGNSRYVAH